MGNIVVTAILILIIVGACSYIYREKKKGNHCIGCSFAGSCPKRETGCPSGPSDLPGGCEMCENDFSKDK